MAVAGNALGPGVPDRPTQTVDVDDCAAYIFCIFCMSATRTPIYLTEVQRHRIDQVTASEGIPMAEVIRRALDEASPHSSP